MMIGKFGRSFASSNGVAIRGEYVAMRMMSSSATPAKAISSSTQGYAKHRSDYEEKLTKLRKVWQREFEEKKAMKEKQLQEEKRRVVQEKAIRLREKRKASVARQEEDRKIKEEDHIRYKEQLARKHILWEERRAKQQERYQKVVQDLVREQPCWITADNINEKITTDLFSKEAATTGLVSKYSDLWRYQVLSTEYQLEKLFHPEKYEMSPAEAAEAGVAVSALEKRLKAKQEARLTRRLWMEDFLDPMIGTGEERAQYQQIVDGYLQTFDEDTWDDPDRLHDEDLDNEAIASSSSSTSTSMRTAVAAEEEDGLYDDEFDGDYEDGIEDYDDEDAFEEEEEE